MISDENGRYALAALDDTNLWRYDARWRRVTEVQPTPDHPFEFHEGNGYFMLVHFGAGTVECSVRPVNAPYDIYAAGEYADGEWEFLGNAEVWAYVPEYLLVPMPSDDKPAGSPRGLLRISDGFVPEEIEIGAPATAVVGVPNSRLVVISSADAISVYDPQTRMTGFKFALKGANPRPTMRFRVEPEELWINDADTMLKLETKSWSVIDAAGSEPGEDGTPAPNISSWSFSPDQTTAAVVRPATNNVVVLDTTTLEILGVVDLNITPTDALITSDRKLVVRTAGGKALRGKIDKAAAVVS